MWKLNILNTLIKIPDLYSYATNKNMPNVFYVDIYDPNDKSITHYNFILPINNIGEDNALLIEELILHFKYIYGENLLQVQKNVYKTFRNVEIEEEEIVIEKKDEYQMNFVNQDIQIRGFSRKGNVKTVSMNNNQQIGIAGFSRASTDINTMSVSETKKKTKKNKVITEWKYTPLKSIFSFTREINLFHNQLLLCKSTKFYDGKGGIIHNLVNISEGSNVFYYPYNVSNEVIEKRKQIYPFNVLNSYYKVKNEFLEQTPNESFLDKYKEHITKLEHLTEDIDNIINEISNVNSDAEYYNALGYKESISTYIARIEALSLQKSLLTEEYLKEKAKSEFNTFNYELFKIIHEKEIVTTSIEIHEEKCLFFWPHNLLKYENLFGASYVVIDHSMDKKNQIQSFLHNYFIKNLNRLPKVNESEHYDYWIVISPEIHRSLEMQIGYNELVSIEKQVASIYSTVELLPVPINSDIVENIRNFKLLDLSDTSIIEEYDFVLYIKKKVYEIAKAKVSDYNIEKTRITLFCLLLNEEDQEKLPSYFKKHLAYIEKETKTSYNELSVEMLRSVIYKHFNFNNELLSKEDIEEFDVNFSDLIEYKESYLPNTEYYFFFFNLEELLTITFDSKIRYNYVFQRDIVNMYLDYLDIIYCIIFYIITTNQEDIQEEIKVIDTYDENDLLIYDNPILTDIKLYINILNLIYSNIEKWNKGVYPYNRTFTFAPELYKVKIITLSFFNYRNGKFNLLKSFFEPKDYEIASHIKSIYPQLQEVLIIDLYKNKIFSLNVETIKKILDIIIKHGMKNTKITKIAYELVYDILIQNPQSDYVIIDEIIKLVSIDEKLLKNQLYLYFGILADKKNYVNFPHNPQQMISMHLKAFLTDYINIRKENLKMLDLTCYDLSYISEPAYVVSRGKIEKVSFLELGSVFNVYSEAKVLLNPNSSYMVSINPVVDTELDTLIMSEIEFF